MIERPRILYLSGWPIGARGEGAVSFVYEQIEALSGSVRATYIEPRFTSVWGWPARVATGRDVERMEELWPGHVAAATIWLPRWPTRVTRRSHLEDLRQAADRLARRLARRFGQIDLIHAHVALPAGLIGAALSQTLGVPLLLQEHSAPFEMHLDTPEKRALVRFTLDRAAVIIAVGDDLAERIRAIAPFPDRVRVVPNLVRTDLFRPRARRAERDTLAVITVASLESRKGHAELLEAISLLADSGLPIRLRIVGEGSLRGELERRIASSGLQERVLLLGSRRREEVADLIAESDLYVCASHLETFGLAPAEALAVGRPVVTTRCGGPESYVDDSSGAVVAARDPAALAEGIRATAERLGQFAPERLHRHIDERFGPAAFRTRMLSLYQAMLTA